MKTVLATVLLGTLAVVGFGVVNWLSSLTEPPESAATPTPPDQHSTSTDSAPEDEALITREPSAPDRQVYINQEWRFSFEYPKGWETRENSFENYYSQFNVTLYPMNAGYKGRPVIVNVVLPEFTESTFSGLEKETVPVTVDGVEGIQYTYEFRSSTNTSIVLPFGEHALLLGTNGHYPELFEGIFDSFEFIE